MFTSNSNIDLTLENNNEPDIPDDVTEIIMLDDEGNNVGILIDNNLLLDDAVEITYPDGHTDMIPVIDVPSMTENRTTILNNTSSKSTEPTLYWLNS